MNRKGGRVYILEIKCLTMGKVSRVVRLSLFHFVKRFCLSAAAVNVFDGFLSRFKMDPKRAPFIWDVLVVFDEGVYVTFGSIDVFICICCFSDSGNLFFYFCTYRSLRSVNMSIYV